MTNIIVIIDFNLWTFVYKTLNEVGVITDLNVKFKTYEVNCRRTKRISLNVHN